MNKQDTRHVILHFNIMYSALIMNLLIKTYFTLNIVKYLGVFFSSFIFYGEEGETGQYFQKMSFQILF